MSRAAAIALALLAGLAACGRDGTVIGGGDAGAGVDFAPPPCQVEFGHTYVFDKLAILPSGEGVDITGDGVPDNLLGKLAPIANPFLQDTLDGGSTIFLVDFTAWDGVSADDPQVGVTFYLGVDADDPPDPSDDFSGAGEFLVVDRAFDVECRPIGKVDDGQIVGGVALASGSTWRFLVQGVGTVVYQQVKLAADFEDGGGGLVAKLGAAWPICNLWRISGPVFAGRTMLGGVVNNFQEPVPDLDLDGDGLERLIGDGDDVVGCIDGDGTVVEGPDCPCDPRMADGYSVSVDVHAVTAAITGILYAP
jgi:uncharacterized protein (DUF2249 family)